MQKIATKVFVVSSVAFGILGSLFWITAPRGEETSGDVNHLMLVLLGITVSIILSSFALSVASKYLMTDD